jgi:hypothetical protein
MFGCRKISYICCTALGLTVAGQVGQAEAACSQADISGAWQFYALDTYGSGSTWIRCMLQINPNGIFDNAGSTCNAMSGAPLSVFGSFQLIGTQLCIFNGVFTLNGTQAQLTRATMDRSKDHVDGVGNYQGGTIFYNLTKP